MTKIFQRISSKGYARFMMKLAVSTLFFWTVSSQATPVQWVELPNAGIDSDYDGVRDDVAAEIRQRYSKVRDRRWPMEIARATQRHVTSDGNPFAVYRAQSEMQRAIRCITKSNNEEVAESVRNEILGLVLNTNSRRLAYSSSVALWEEDIRHRELPARPDDRWQESCGTSRPITHIVRKAPPPQMVEHVVEARPKPAAAPVKTTPMTSSFGMEVEPMQSMPAPNFFITGEVPVKQGTETTAASTQAKRKPVLIGDDATSLPDAFRVKPQSQQMDRLSSAFLVDAQQERAQPRSSQAVAVEPIPPANEMTARQRVVVEPPAVTRQATTLIPAPVPAHLNPEKTSEAEPSIEAIAQMPETAEQSAVVTVIHAAEPSAKEPENTVEATAETVTEIKLPVEQVDTPVIKLVEEPTELPEEEPLPTELAIDEERRGDELVVVVKKGKEGSSSVLVTPLGVDKEMPVEKALEAVLPPALLELAPFIKSFKYLSD